MLTNLLFGCLLASPMQVHLADFSRTDTPNGLSRRGYGGEPASYAHGATDWFQQFFDGDYRLVNPGGTGGNTWVCLDLGTGLGDETLPGPLVAGGAFTDTPPATQPDFGPYAVPFTFRVDFEDWGQFANASVSGSAAPQGMTALAGRKAIGVTFVINNQESANIAPRQLTAGIIDDGTGPVLDIYDNARVSVAASSPVPVTGLLPGDAWTLRVRINATSIAARIMKGETTVHAIQAQKVVAGSPGVLVSAASARSAAFRALGFVTPTLTPIDVDLITVDSANILPFDGPEVGSAGPQPSLQPFVLRQGDELVLDAGTDPAEDAGGGGRLQAAGTNRVDLLNYFAGFDATPEYAEYLLDQLVENTDQRVVRFACSDEFSKYIRPYNAGWAQANYPLFELFEEDPAHDAYFTALDRLVDAATDRGLYLVPVLLWDAANPYCHANQVQRTCALDPVAVRTCYDVGGTPASGSPEEQAQDLIVEFVQGLAVRYADHPAILAWEIGNEWDNECDRSLHAWPTPSSFSTACPVPPTEVPWPWFEWWAAPAQCAAAQDFVAGEIASATSSAPRRHPISSGHAEAASRFDDVTLPGLQQTPAQFAATLPLFYGSLVDIVSVHYYGGAVDACGNPPSCTNWPPVPFSSWDELLHDLRAASKDMGRPTMLGETNYNADPYDDQRWQETLDAFSGSSSLGATPRASVALSWAWMAVPHMAFDDSFDMRPAHLLSTDPTSTAYRAVRFEEFTETTSAAPRVLSSGWGTTFAQVGQPLGAQVLVRVADMQGLDDVVAVRLLNAAGTSTVLNLARAGSSSLWTGALLPSFVPSEPRTLFYQVEAEDAEGNKSLRAPRFTFAPPVPGPGPTPAGGNTVNGGGASVLPYVRLAGAWGFNPQSREGGHLHCVAHVVDANGTALTEGQVTVYGRWNTNGLLGPADGWVGNGLFSFHDDGSSGGDLIANDGWWSSDMVFDEDDLTAIPSQEMLVEVLAVVLPGGGTVYSSDIWPRLVVH